MAPYGGPPSWVGKQNEAILKMDADRMASEMEEIKKENAKLQKELETTRKALKECEKRLSETTPGT